MTSSNNPLTTLTHDQLHQRIGVLMTTERRCTLAIIDHLGEMDRRRLYRDRGHSSLYAYVTDELGYSSASATRRISAARAVSRFPRIRQLLLERRITLGALSMVARDLTRNNVAEIVGELRGASLRDAQLIQARLRGTPERRERIVPVAPVAAQTNITKATVSEPTSVADTAALTGSVVRSRPAINDVSSPDAPRDHLQNEGKTLQTFAITQLNKRFRVEFNIGEQAMINMERAMSLASHRMTRAASTEQLFELMLECYLDKHDPERREMRRRARKNKASSREAGTASGVQTEKRDYGNHKNEVNNRAGACSQSTVNRKKVQTPGARRDENPMADLMTNIKTTSRVNAKASSSQKQRSRAIPAATRDVVFARDAGQCRFVNASGERCGETHHLQIDHIVPFARGGSHRAENLRLLCANHNRLCAEREFGGRVPGQRPDGFMEVLE